MDNKENKNTTAELVKTAAAVWEQADMVEYAIDTRDLTDLDEAVIKELYDVGGGEVPEGECGELLLTEDDAGTVENTARHGCDGGAFSSLIYYSDTIAFFERNRAAILAQLREDVENGLFEARTIFGAVWEMLKRGGHVSDDTATEDEAGISAALYGPLPLEWDCEGVQTQTANLLAWYAAEQTCSKLYDNDGHALSTGTYWHNTKTGEYVEIDYRDDNPQPPTAEGGEDDDAAASDSK